MRITTILNLYKRPQNLEKQVAAVQANIEYLQSLPMSGKIEHELWLWSNNPNITGNDYDLSKFDLIVTASKNMKFHGRFALANLAPNGFISILDDDTIPGKKWYWNCFREGYARPAIFGGAGVILESRAYAIPGMPQMHTRVGWPSKNEKTVNADLVGHAWFFSRDILTHLWREVPITMENCEDMQLSYMAQKYGNIPTLCPPHPESDREMWSSLYPNELGDDQVASSNARNPDYQKFCDLRNMCVSYFIDNGWKTVRNIK